MNEINNKSSKSHWYWWTVTFAALVIAILGGLNHFVQWKLLNNERKQYQPLALINNTFDDSNTVGPRINRILQGYTFVSDVDLFEYRNAPPFWPPLAATIFLPFRFFTQSISAIIIATDIIFPILFFFLLLFFLLNISNNRRWPSLIGAMIFSIYPQISLHLPPISRAILWQFISSVIPTGTKSAANLLMRRESFIPGILPVFLFLITIYRALTYRRKVEIILAGLTFALTSYFYPYHFLYLSAAIGILTLLLILIKDWHRLIIVIQMSIIAAIALIPFAAMQIAVRSLPSYKDIFIRYGVEIGRFFRYENWPRYLWLLLLAGIIYQIYQKRNQKEQSSWILIVSLLIAGIIVLNIQLILGYNVQSDHWVTRDIFLGMDFACFLILLFLYDWLYARYQKIRKISIIITSIFLITLTITTTTNIITFAVNTHSRSTLPSELSTAFTWLNKNTTPDSIIVSPSLVTNSLIPLFTHNRVYLPEALDTFASNKEIQDRLFRVYRFFEVPETYLKNALSGNTQSDESYTNQEAGLFFFLFSVSYVPQRSDIYTNPTERTETEKIQRDVSNQILSDYHVFQCTNCLQTYRADYVFFGPSEQIITSKSFDNTPDLQKVYDKNGVKIFHIINSQILN